MTIKEMSTDEIRGEIYRLRDNEDSESIERVAALRAELNERLKDVPLPEIEEEEEEGSYALGFCLAFFLTVVGCIIALLADKPATKRGALHGIITEIIVAVVVVPLVFLFLYLRALSL